MASFFQIRYWISPPRQTCVIRHPDPLVAGGITGYTVYVARLLVLLLAASNLLTASVATEVARQFEQMSLDPEECYRVTELNLSKEDIKLYLSSGYLIFAKPIAGFRQGAL